MTTASDFHDNGTTPATIAPTLSMATVQILLSLIDSLTIQMGNPQAESQFASLLQARRELQGLLP